MDKNQKIILWSIIIVIILLVIFSFYFYYRGKKQTTISKLPTDNPAAGNGGVQVSGAQISDNDVSLLADQLYDDITSIFQFRNNSLYERLVALSDTDLVRIYNAYNTKYQSKNGETLLQALKNEITAWFGNAKYNMEAIINRLSKYNLI